MVTELFEAAKIEPRNLSDIGVTLGPGSFTGVRVGLSFAKGMATALGLKLKGVGTLEALAFHRDLRDDVRLSTIDGGRGRFYVQRFSPDGRDDAMAITLNDDISLLADVSVLTGPAAARLKDRFPGAWIFDQNNPVTGSLYDLMLTPGHDDVTPLYMRDADAVVSTRGTIAPVTA